jgi:nicotinamidase-related amidase
MIIPELEDVLKKYSDRNQVILIGMETHVCVLQTFLDLK